ncbi:MAG: hypothetical protein KKB30_16905 [Proteobacteria bacterium]|nr:hypothetical protein [Pseudomonadota bacterium]MBU1716051.1 hypothetical protein [Pseudomonadota bacterium]
MMQFLPGSVRLFLFVSFCCLISAEAGAAVTGPCGNCHTMHNSQDGKTAGSAAYGTGNDRLLRTDCVGCHSSATGDTIITTGGGYLPIVFNTNAYPAQPLAGGNFYYTNLGDSVNDQYGHNVLGIANPDLNIPHVPGKGYGGLPKTITECIGCHQVFTNSPFMYARPGNVLICIDCHVFPKHHADDSATVVGAAGGWYRFIDEVSGIEDDDWEQTVGVADHNEYQGEIVKDGGSMSDWGCMCHNDFHALVNPSGVGVASPWLRHPSDIALPSVGEYAGYTVYDPQVPVARPDLSGYGAPSATVTPGTDQVMCLSCHRAHGSDQPDMLRWPYIAMLTDDPSNPAVGTGCFVCHSTKDG